MEMTTEVILFSDRYRGLQFKFYNTQTITSKHSPYIEVQLSYIDNNSESNNLALGRESKEIILPRFLEGISKNLKGEAEGMRDGRPTFWILTLSGPYTTLLISRISMEGNYELLAVNSIGNLILTLKLDDLVLDTWRKQLHVLLELA